MTQTHQMVPGLVSVMMPSYNAERFIHQAIESLLRQDYTDWELIVVNDGSTDKTAEIARTFDDPRIQVVDQANGGEAAARNTALGRMRGEFVAFLDADDAYLPCHLQLAVGHLQAKPDRDAVYSDGYHIDEAGARLQTLSSRRLPPSEGMIFEQVVRASCMLGPPLCVVLRRGLIEKCRLSFDTSIPWGTDWDFFTRYAEVGQFGNISQPTCLYRLHSANITTEIGAVRRASYLASYRIKATRLRSFEHCSLQTRVAVFHDLLVNLLRGDPEQQTSVTQGGEFKALPAPEQARLLRLMASKTVLYEPQVRQVVDWLHLSRTLDPSDKRAALLSAVYTLSPLLCRLLLRIKTTGQLDPRRLVPFADLKPK